MRQWAERPNSIEEERHVKIWIAIALLCAGATAAVAEAAAPPRARLAGYFEKHHSSLVTDLGRPGIQLVGGRTEVVDGQSRVAGVTLDVFMSYPDASRYAKPTARQLCRAWVDSIRKVHLASMFSLVVVFSLDGEEEASFPSGGANGSALC